MLSRLAGLLKAISCCCKAEFYQGRSHVLLAVVVECPKQRVGAQFTQIVSSEYSGSHPHFAAVSFQHSMRTARMRSVRRGPYG